MIAQGLSPVEAFNQIDVASRHTINALKANTIPISTKDLESLKYVATIAANNDSELGDMIAEIFSRRVLNVLLLLNHPSMVKRVTRLLTGLKCHPV